MSDASYAADVVTMHTTCRICEPSCGPLTHMTGIPVDLRLA